MALDALGKFAEETFTSELRKTVVVNGVSHLITTENRYERRTFEVNHATTMYIHVYIGYVQALHLTYIGHVKYT